MGWSWNFRASNCTFKVKEFLKISNEEPQLNFNFFNSPPRNGGILSDGFLFAHVLGPIGTQSTNHDLGAVGTNPLTPSSSPPSNSSTGSVHGGGLSLGMVTLQTDHTVRYICNKFFVSFVKVCGRCEMQASNRCLDCNDVLCETCVVKHQGHQPFQEHCVVLLSNLSPIGSSNSIANGSPTHNEPQCDSHGEVLRYVAVVKNEHLFCLAA